jgi:hypothetical protein
MAFSGMLRRVVLLRIDVSEGPSASFISVIRIGELGTTLAVTSNRRTLRRNTWYQIPPEPRFLQEPHGLSSQQTPFFIVTAVKTSNLITYRSHHAPHTKHHSSVKVYSLSRKCACFSLLPCRCLVTGVKVIIVLYIPNISCGCDRGRTNAKGETRVNNVDIDMKTADILCA